MPLSNALKRRTCGNVEFLFKRLMKNKLKIRDTDKICGQNIEDNMNNEVIHATKQVIYKNKQTD